MKANEEIIREYFHYNRDSRFLLNHVYILNGLLESAKINWNVEHTQNKLNHTKEVLSKTLNIIQHPIRLLFQNKKLKKEITKIIDEQ